MRNRIALGLVALAFVGVVIAVELNTNPSNTIAGWLLGVAVVAAVAAFFVWENG